MKKVGIVTIAVENSYNYGNKLQIFALQEFLRRNGYESTAIRYEAEYVRAERGRDGTSLLAKLIKGGQTARNQSFLQTCSDFCRIANRSLCKNVLRQKRENREDGFRSFEKTFIDYTRKIYDITSDLNELVALFDCFITGSDQVWNPYYEGADAFYYLGFAPKGKRIAYAPSIGYDAIPQQMKEIYAGRLNQIDHLSVREASAKKLLKDEFGLDARLVCDPVFLVDRRQWEKIAKYAGGKRKYFVSYILGKKTVEIKALIRKYEKTFGIRGLDIYTRDDPTSAFADPQEFLGFIANAEFVLTDSFHGTSFALIFQKPVAVLKRDAETVINTRIDSVLQALGVGNRDAGWILAEEGRMPIDYTQVRTKQDAFIKDSKQYLLTAIKQSENCGFAPIEKFPEGGA